MQQQEAPQQQTLWVLAGWCEARQAGRQAGSLTHTTHLLPTKNTRPDGDIFLWWRLRCNFLCWLATHKRESMQRVKYFYPFLLYAPPEPCTSAPSPPPFRPPVSWVPWSVSDNTLFPINVIFWFPKCYISLVSGGRTANTWHTTRLPRVPQEKCPGKFLHYRILQDEREPGAFCCRKIPSSSFSSSSTVPLMLSVLQRPHNNIWNSRVQFLSFVMLNFCLLQGGRLLWSSFGW